MNNKFEKPEGKPQVMEEKDIESTVDEIQFLMDKMEKKTFNSLVIFSFFT